MPQLHTTATIIEAAGTKAKIIQEFVGHVNSNNDSLSIARMQSPQGWEEPGQRPEFDEYTVVLAGTLHVETEGGETITVCAGQAITLSKGEWVRYSTPGERGAEYIAVCLPAFSPDTVHRNEECG